MSFPTGPAVIAVGVLVAAVAAGAPAYAAASTCAATNVVVHAEDPRDAAIACEAAAAAARFFEAQGLDVTARIEVHLVPALPGVARPEASGCYVHRERRVYALDFRAFRKQGRFLELPVDRVLHRSLITHEVAHAFAACNFGVAQPTLTAQEYIAYTAMFATMPEGHRLRVLERLPGEGFESELAINLTIYFMNPDLFGAQSYRHFLKPDHGRAFVGRVLSGNALAWEEPL